jgi:hypothetical protein
MVMMGLDVNQWLNEALFFFFFKKKKWLVYFGFLKSEITKTSSFDLPLSAIF